MMGMKHRKKRKKEKKKFDIYNERYIYIGINFRQVSICQHHLDRSTEREDPESTKSRTIFAIYPEASVVESIEQKQKLSFVVYR